MKITQVIKSTVAAAVFAGVLFLAPAGANARVFVSVGIAPPVIPVYEQPLAPGYGYIWTPGYWAYGDDGYYWVDGAWVYPPYVEALWTPGYWGWGGGGYFWNAGYWGRSIGYYGGINYGFGYFGTGFYGGYWNSGHFFYNGAYNHIGFHNGFVYNHPVAGFDGHPGGAAFARNEGANHGAENYNRGAAVNGNAFANRGSENFNRGAENANRGAGNFNRNAGSYSGTATYASRPAYNGAATRNYTGGNSFPQGRSPTGEGAQVQSQAHTYTGGSSYGGGGQAQARSSGGNAGGGSRGGGGRR